MLEKTHEGPVTVLRMGRSAGSRVLYITHSFLLQNTLIDTGTAYVRDEFLAALDGSKVSAVINTHHHEDHTGNNRAVMDRWGAGIYAHPDALPCLDDPKAMNLHLYQRVVWGYPDPSKGGPIPDIVHTPGYTLKVLSAPGHTKDHLCFYEPERRWLFTGDIYCGRRIKYFRADEDFMTTLASLTMLAKLDTDIIFCSLLGVVRGGKAALKAKIASLEDLLGRTRDLHARGLSPKRIKLKLLGPEGAMCYITAGHYSKQNAIDSILKGAALSP